MAIELRFPQSVWFSSSRTHRVPTLACSLILSLGVMTRPSMAQSSVAGSGPLFTVAVNEVSLTFHAYDAAGQCVNNLTPSDLTIYDNLEPPRKILVLKLLRDQPVHAGILLDTSESMQGASDRSRAVATEYVERYLHLKTDRAFIDDFGYISRILQPWTGDPRALAAGVSEAVPGSANPSGGTALFETVYSACLYQFGESDRPASGNLILLFTDGEDTSSQVDLKSAVDECQRANTAVYVFRPEEQGPSTGPANLSRLTSETGGRMFYLDEGNAEVRRDLNWIDADVRDRYWLVYRPAQLTHDGSFHEIYVGTSRPDTTIDVNAGYYAPSR
ncbi:MAG TPA: VWA domain-containing protein [Acidobacteriaceae bacterium]|nr:VWA domain-containing protein [Acidobacteriaceae bacterium]